ncbi:APC family permease [Kerstersia gyiorum]|uniref:Amino acid/polyamine/organocation transporter (APC superfamily) n=1 Tax=Kerstersia gyiorum TaxID=206506 RepID=A0A171KTT5_9BURK|nr:APC family permease [Kerstersia gyiorum]MCO7640825.1 APC family permease [Pseudomonas sp. S 311-6]KAB0543303.1 amino acid permease [Kerstersia gyiorum]KKO72302.1 hypothetical protein AAV32_04105 [Kerstersia gyiorum]MCP1632761.1 amino acid transporter [Kerstersia gyiorum]MCP1635708.1 amino acid transporter [Kerstersia gyiorum]
MATHQSKQTLNLIDVISIGIGAMVGAGIFVLIGQVAELMDTFTWFSFGLAGVVSLLIGYAYARLSVYYPTNGGLIDYFRAAFSRPLVITLSFLYIGTLILTIALVARAFGLYAAQWLHPGHANLALLGLAYTLGIIVLLALLNMYSNHAVGRTESLLVILKLGILLIFIIAGAVQLKPTSLIPSPLPGADPIFSSLGLTFFAYAGFNMMTNAADKVKNPARTMPLAFILAISITMLLYVALAIILASSLSMAQLRQYAETSIAYAAYPVLGATGFVMVSAGALLATSSAINATIFSLFNTLDSMGQSREIPAALNRPLWRNASSGNVVISIAIAVLALCFDVSVLADVVSFTFLASYFFVLIAAWRMRARIHLGAGFLLLTLAIVSLIMLGFLYSLATSNLMAIASILAALALCAGLAFWRNRHISAGGATGTRPR